MVVKHTKPSELKGLILLAYQSIYFETWHLPRSHILQVRDQKQIGVTIHLLETKDIQPQFMYQISVTLSTVHLLKAMNVQPGAILLLTIVCLIEASQLFQIEETDHMIEARFILLGVTVNRLEVCIIKPGVQNHLVEVSHIRLYIVRTHSQPGRAHGYSNRSHSLSGKCQGYLARSLSLTGVSQRCPYMQEPQFSFKMSMSREELQFACVRPGLSIFKAQFTCKRFCVQQGAIVCQIEASDVHIEAIVCKVLAKDVQLGAKTNYLVEVRAQFALQISTMFSQQVQFTLQIPKMFSWELMFAWLRSGMLEVFFCIQDRGQSCPARSQ